MEENVVFTEEEEKVHILGYKQASFEELQRSRVGLFRYGRNET